MEIGIGAAIPARRVLVELETFQQPGRWVAVRCVVRQLRPSVLWCILPDLERGPAALQLGVWWQLRGRSRGSVLTSPSCGLSAMLTRYRRFPTSVDAGAHAYFAKRFFSEASRGAAEFCALAFPKFRLARTIPASPSQ